MKTQVLQLEPQDDVISVRDKMTWGQTRRILLIWPSRIAGQDPILNRRLDLVLLQRQATSLGAQLALITAHPEVRFHAKELGIPIFDTPLQAQNARWRSGRRRKIHLPEGKQPFVVTERPSRLTRHPSEAELLNRMSALAFILGRLLPFLLSMLALLALAALFLPGASITLTPQTRRQQISLPVTASPNVQTVNLAGLLPAKPLSVIVEGRASREASGEILLPVSAAVGNVRFTNLTGVPVSIPKGTVVSTLDPEPIRFVTTRSGKVPAGAGMTITLPVTALMPGSRGNLPASSLTAIEGNLGLSLSADNPFPTRGGSESPAPAPSAEDRQTLYRTLYTSLEQSALQDMQNTLTEGDFLLAPTLEAQRILEATYTPAEGQVGQTLELLLRIEFGAYFISKADLQALVHPLLEASLPQGFQPVPGSLEIRAATPPIVDEKGAVTWELQAQQQLQAAISPSQVNSLVLGQALPQAKQRLETELRLADQPQVNLFPAWWPRLPFLAMRIQLTVLNPSW